MTVPIWLSLISAALAIPSVMAAAMMAGLVQKLSSPTSWIRLAEACGERFQPSWSASPRPSSMLQIGNAVIIAA